MKREAGEQIWLSLQFCFSSSSMFLSLNHLNYWSTSSFKYSGTSPYATKLAFHCRSSTCYQPVSKPWQLMTKLYGIELLSHLTVALTKLHYHQQIFLTSPGVLICVCQLILFVVSLQQFFQVLTIQDSKFLRICNSDFMWNVSWHYMSVPLWIFNK